MLQRVSEIPFQTHIAARSWPSGNDPCPLLMQLAILRGLKAGGEQRAVCPFCAVNMKSWAQGTYTADALKIPSSCLLDHWKLPAGVWQEADIAHPSAPPLLHPQNTPLSLGCPTGLLTGSSPTSAGCLLCWFPLRCGHSCTMVPASAQPLSL